MFYNIFCTFVSLSGFTAVPKFVLDRLQNEHGVGNKFIQVTLLTQMSARLLTAMKVKGHCQRSEKPVGTGCRLFSEEVWGDVWTC